MRPSRPNTGWATFHWRDGCLLGASALIFWMGFQEPSQAQTEPSFTMEDVRAAWARRQEKITSFKISWDTRRIGPKGRGGPQGGRRKKLPSPTSKPPEYQESHYSRTLLVDKGRTRFTQRGDYWSAKAKAYVPFRYTKAWDGKQGATLDECLIKDGHLEGYIATTSSAVSVESVLPPLMAVWPLHPHLGRLKIENYQATAQTAEIESHSCALLKSVSAETIFNEIWVDPGRDYLVLRMDNRVGDLVRDQLDFTYEHDPQRGFYPVQWRWVRMSRLTGRLSKDDQSTVIEYSFTPKVEDADFRIEFPVGCLVFDGRKPEQLPYLVLAGGGNRRVLDEEWRAGVPVDTLMKTEPGAPLAQASNTWMVWVGCGLTLGSVISLLVLLRRHLRRT